jgi:soluble lytic murein transglycosylase-like protein
MEVSMKMPSLPVQLRKGWQAVVGAAQGVLAGFGLLALVLVAIEGGRVLPFGPKVTTEFAGPIDAAHALEPGLAAAPDPQHKVLAGYLARRYRVAGDATVDLVSESYAVGRAVGLDPLLILAVISVESRFNPIAESDMGAKGLMQVIPRFHTEKLAVHGGEDAVLDPKTNILVGAQILKEYIRLAGGLEAGLQMYNGASYDPSQGYAQKVIAEKQRLEQALRGIRPSGTSA